MSPVTAPSRHILIDVAARDLSRMLAAALARYGECAEAATAGAAPASGNVALIVTEQSARHLTSGIPLIYLSEFADPQMERECVAAVVKPFRLDDLLEAVERALDMARPSGTRPFRILAVDDDRAFLDRLAAVLRQAGYEVHEAHDGAEALALLDRLHGDLDLAIIDLVLPKRSGFEVIGALTRRPNRIKILAASAVYGGLQLDAAEWLGAHACIAKPRPGQALQAAEWLAAVRSLLPAQARG